MRVLVVDDEPAARRRLAIMLEELDVEVVGQAQNGVEALERVRDRKPDVVLLDISMPEVDGFDVARHLPEPRPLIIFQTAYDEFALRAFEHEALDYVVKPVTLERLTSAIDRARARLESAAPPRLPNALVEQIQEAIAERVPTSRARILVREGAGHRLLAFREITRFTAKDGVVHAHTDSGRYLADYTLSDLEARTPGSFLRPNRSELVSIDRIERIKSNGDGSASITLSDGTVAHVTRRRAAEVKKALST
ncbi:MAG: response regulator [Gemmatimonadota bacterium]